jgi:UDP-N-acetylmuramate--alanine ligase
MPYSQGATIIEHITIPTPGRHNILNALAAIAIGIELNFGIKTITNGFKGFQGVKRRFTRICTYKEAEIIDDYAHHPAEVSATLATARNIADNNGSRVIAIFQPHKYSRLQNLFDDFTKCFNDADQLYIMDVYSAGEQAIENINSKLLVQELTKVHKNVSYLANHESLPDIVKNNASKGDLFVMMGAGSISTWANQLPAKLN